MRRVLELLGLSLLTGASLLIATVAAAETKKKPPKPVANDTVINDIKIGNKSQFVQTGRTAPPSKQVTGRPQSLQFQPQRLHISSKSRHPSNQDSSTNPGAVGAPAPTRAARDILPMSTGVPIIGPR